jgi:DNA-directed RNA polymerase specialized sigma24 family protein
VKAPPRRNGNVLHRQLQARNHKAKVAIKSKSSRFDALVARYYPAVYNFASRLTDDPREAIALTRDAFNSSRRELRNCCDDNVFASILISTVIRSGLTAA